MLLAPDTLLEVDKVSKIYSRNRAVAQRRLGRTLRRVLTGRGFDSGSTQAAGGEFQAVKDVSFSLKRGEAMGILGLNGSGKTTLLRMLAGQILPDAGSITAVGRSASMIDLQAGFQPSASGRENIFLRGAALGRSRSQMVDDFDSILAFSELGDAIDAPLASYSAGMTMRLAFSIVASTAPELMFIDEVLAVGDFRFRQKCLARMRELRDRCALVMVSHSPEDIKKFCDRAMVMHRGVVMFNGTPAEAADFYANIQAETTAQPVEERKISTTLQPQFENSDGISDMRCFWCDENLNEKLSFATGEDVYLYCEFKTAFDVGKVTIGVPLWNSKGEYCTGFSTDRAPDTYSTASGTVEKFLLKIPALPLNVDSYHANITVLSGLEFLIRKAIPVLNITSGPTPRWGMVDLPYQWSKLN